MLFLSLPLEVLQHIAGCVETAHRPSLYAFSLTSKACHRAATLLVFQQIVITVHDRERLQCDVDRLIESLSRTDSFRHIQSITIKGALRPKVERQGGYGPQPPYLAITGLDEVLVDEEPYSYHDLYKVDDEDVIEKFSEEDMAWAPVVNLLQAKIHLRDLVYDCRSQFPPSLLRALHEQHPQSRLHHLTFRFRTLAQDIPNSYEMALATSPSLYRVKLTCALRDTDGYDDFNLEALLELTAGLATNLKQVIVLNLVPACSLRSVRPRGSWQRLPGFTDGKVGSLTSLSLKGYSRLNSPKMLQDWSRYTDFACLQHLTLGGCYDAQKSGLSGETMEWVGQNHFFPRVKTLSVYLTRDNFFHDRPHYSDHAVSFFQAFESLEELSIDGPIDSKILDTVLSRHGQTLKKLSFHPFEERHVNANGRDPLDIPFQFTKDHCLQIEVQCPVLEELAIPVKRNMSSASETKMYRCFGRMKNLRSLFLILDCSNWQVTRDSTYNLKFDEDDRKTLVGFTFPFLTRGVLKEAFINCAVDETLARSIWKIIIQNKTGRRLERLKLWPTGGAVYGLDTVLLGISFRFMIQNMTRSWILERDPREDEEELFTVRELGQHKRKIHDENNVGYMAHNDPEILEVFRSIWPPKEDSYDWRDDWSSFPLQG
ncbi:hypothetical protein BOTCAL_0132g00220 [Botryotinia calthae]|uniref:Uncharacterized protein n=1 Tax=Botryotinia calthae TaxID=38488 RepID=A0A4Y8D480_9HELO|nr:hypothetical protein BOTCAL_0132g00220 [Botryotinia calthae]